jgi:hypothetical protein
MDGENSSKDKHKPHPSWEEIVRRGADKNYNYDKDYYYSKMKTRDEESIDFWKTTRLKYKIQDNKNGEKLIAKLRAKLDALV